MKAIYYNNWDTAFIPHILKEIYLDRIYERFLVGRDNLTIVDLGANIGLFSAYVAPYCKELICVEPDENHCECIKANLKDFDNFEVKKLAVANMDGKKTFFLNKNNTTAHTLLGGNKKDSVEVDVLSLDSLLGDVPHIDLLKMDIEGAEFEVLCGNKAARALKKTDVIIGEYHSFAGRNFNQIMDALKASGFNVREFKNSINASMFLGER